nr:MAG TPA: hypothetical protein [Caudoviricetes sp.]
MLNTSSPTIMPHRATSKNAKKLIKMYAVAAHLLLIYPAHPLIMFIPVGWPSTNKEARLWISKF